jgi:hypothetical protein
MNQISKDFGKVPALIRRSDGMTYDLHEIQLEKSDKILINAMFYLKVCDLSNEQLFEFTKYVVSNLLISTNSRMTADKIVEFRQAFQDDLMISSRNISIQEVKLICYNGIRGAFLTESIDCNFTVANYHKWMQKYLEKRNVATLKLINAMNSLPGKTEFNFEKIKKSINTILSNKKNNKEFKKQLVSFTSVLPEFIYDKLVENKYMSF